jgi:ribonuclease P protein subunit POP4
MGWTGEIADSTTNLQVGVKGLVVDETKNTLTIETEKGMKKIQKKGSVFIFKISSEKKVKVNGNKIAVRPEDRLKLKVKKW